MGGPVRFGALATTLVTAGRPGSRPAPPRSFTGPTRVVRPQGAIPGVHPRSATALHLLLPLSLLCVGCTAPLDPVQVGAQAVDGDLTGACSEVAAADALPPELDGFAAACARWLAADAQRQPLARASREMMRQAVEDAVAGPDPARAATLLAQALHSWPVDPAFLQHSASLEQRARTQTPGQARETWSLLAQLFEGEPARAEPYRALARQGSIERRYDQAALAATRTAQRGVALPAVGRLLAMLDYEYVDAPPWSDLAARGAQQVTWLAASPAARVAWPGLAQAPPPPGLAASDLPSTLQALDALVAWATAAGLPADVLLAEWTDAALSALDPWTRVIWPEQVQAWTDHNLGVVVGVGLDLRLAADGGVEVVRPVLDAPAWRAPIYQGDRLVGVREGGRSLILADVDAGRRLEAAEAALAGVEGSTVELDLVLPKGGTRTVRLVRAAVPVETVQGWQRNDDNSWSPWLSEADGLAYLRVSQFRPRTEEDFDALLDDGLGAARGLVIDLRGNAGGDVNAAVQIADRFVADGLLAGLDGRVAPKVDATVDAATGQPLVAWNAAVPGHGAEGLPVVVLVDADTASAAEVLAGALQERAGAVVVGQATWGKGHAQALREDPDGAFAVQFTNLVWTLPGGRRLSHEAGGGITPTIAVPTATPGEVFQTERLRGARVATRTHHDGVPMLPLITSPRADLPPLDADPAIAVAELALRAVLASSPEPAAGAVP